MATAWHHGIPLQPYLPILPGGGGWRESPPQRRKRRRREEALPPPPPPPLHHFLSMESSNWLLSPIQKGLKSSYEERGKTIELQSHEQELILVSWLHAEPQSVLRLAADCSHFILKGRGENVCHDCCISASACLQTAAVSDPHTGYKTHDEKKRKYQLCIHVTSI